MTTPFSWLRCGDGHVWGRAGARPQTLVRYFVTYICAYGQEP